MGLLKLHATRACGRSSTLTITYVTPHFGLQIDSLMSDNDAHDEMIYKTNPLIASSIFRFLMIQPLLWSINDVTPSTFV